MKELLPVNDSYANKVSYYLVMLLLLSLPYNMFYSHLILISLALHTIIHFNKNNIKPVFTLSNLALHSVFFLTLLSTIYTVNKPQAFIEWGRQVTIFLMPLIFCFNTLDVKKYRDRLLLVFALGCTACIIYLYINAAITIRYYHLPLTGLFTAAFTNHNFSEPIDIHATFFSMQIGIALIYLVYAFIKATHTGYRVLYLFCSCILLAGIIQLSSKSIFVALLIVINIGLPWFLLKGRARVRFIGIAAALSLMVMAVIYKTDTFKERYVTELKKDLSKATDDENTDPRLARWTVAVNLAAQAPVIGHGAGTEIGLLKDQFFAHKFYRSYLAGLNSHNEFISFLIKTGIAGLLVYLLTLAFGFRLSITENDLLLFAFMVIITAVSFSENYLDIDKGIFFYSVFFSLFIFSDLPENLRPRSKKYPVNATDTGNQKAV